MGEEPLRFRPWSSVIARCSRLTCGDGERDRVGAREPGGSRLLNVRSLPRRFRAWRAAARNRSRASHCFYCGVAFSGEGALQRTVDHRVPRSAGGAHRLGNLVFACRSCNQRKANAPEADFVASDWLDRRRRQPGA